MPAEQTGFCVAHTVRQTPDKGLGVFAEEPIKQGAIVWRHIPGQYIVYDEPSFRAAIKPMSEAEVVYELTHVFGLEELPECLIRVFDAGVLINHSDDANLVTNNHTPRETPLDVSSPDYIQDVTTALLGDRYCLIATRDIGIGEEFTNDYVAECCEPAFFEELYEEYGVEEDYLEDGY